MNMAGTVPVPPVYYVPGPGQPPAAHPANVGQAALVQLHDAPIHQYHGPPAAPYNHQVGNMPLGQVFTTQPPRLMEEHQETGTPFSHQALSQNSNSDHNSPSGISVQSQQQNFAQPPPPMNLQFYPRPQVTAAPNFQPGMAQNMGQQFYVQPPQLIHQHSVPPMSQSYVIQQGRPPVMLPQARYSQETVFLFQPGPNPQPQPNRHNGRRGSHQAYSRTQSESKLQGHKGSGQTTPDQPPPPCTAPPFPAGYLPMPPHPPPAAAAGVDEPGAPPLYHHPYHGGAPPPPPHQNLLLVEPGAAAAPLNPANNPPALYFDPQFRPPPQHPYPNIPPGPPYVYTQPPPQLNHPFGGQFVPPQMHPANGGAATVQRSNSGPRAKPTTPQFQPGQNSRGTTPGQSRINSPRDHRAQQQQQSAAKPAHNDAAPTNATEKAGDLTDYTPPGTPQQLEPVDSDQTAQLCSTMDQDAEDEKQKKVEQLAEQLSQVKVQESEERQKEGNEEDEQGDEPTKMPTEFVNSNYHFNSQQKVWQSRGPSNDMRHSPPQNMHPGMQQQVHPQMAFNQYQQVQFYNQQMPYPPPHHQHPPPPPPANQFVPDPNAPPFDPHQGMQMQRPGAHQQPPPPRFNDRPPPNRKNSNASSVQSHQTDRNYCPPPTDALSWRNPPPKREEQPVHRAAAPPRPTVPTVTECTYCRTLKKPVTLYGTHVMRETNGKTKCPELQKLKCEVCEATGEDAHTQYFCPKRQREMKLEGTAGQLRPFIRDRLAKRERDERLKQQRLNESAAAREFGRGDRDHGRGPGYDPRVYNNSRRRGDFGRGEPRGERMGGGFGKPTGNFRQSQTSLTGSMPSQRRDDRRGGNRR